jgi:dCMP deaminase
MSLYPTEYCINCGKMVTPFDQCACVPFDEIMNKMFMKIDKKVMDFAVDEWDRVYMEIAEKVATQSKCSAKKVGCLIVRDNNILSIGINGTFSGALNCCDRFRKIDGVWYEREHVNNQPTAWKICQNQESHYKWSLIHEVHAEMNALAKANKNGVDVTGATAYVTHSPCYNCAKNLYTFGIRKIYYKNSYDDIKDVKELLSDFDISLIEIK